MRDSPETAIWEVSAPGGLSATLPELLQSQDVGPMPILSFNGGSNSLDTTEVAFCRLDRDMPQKKLNLLQFAPGRPT